MWHYEYKGFWIAIVIEGDELKDCEDPYYYQVYIEYSDRQTTTSTGDRYVTYQEAKIATEKFVDMLEASSESESNFKSDYQQEFIFNQPEAWGSEIIDF